MINSLFAGRSTLGRLHRTVQRNILRQHRHNVRHESSKTAPSPPSTTTSAPAGPARPGAPFGGAYGAYIEPIKVPFRAYESMQSRSPLLTQWETAIVIYFLGDVSAQAVQTSGFTEARYEPIRGLRAVVIGGIVAVPNYKWFLWLGRHFNYPSHLLSLAAKIVFSQCVFTPIFNTYFFAMQSLLSGSTVGEAWERVRKTVPVSWVNSWKLWPIVTAVLFTFVRPQNRSPIAGMIAIFWQTYLSWLNRNAELALRKKHVEEERLKTIAKITKAGKS